MGGTAGAKPSRPWQDERVFNTLQKKEMGAERLLVQCQLNPQDLYKSLHELIRMAYPGAEITFNSVIAADERIDICLKQNKGDGFVTIRLDGQIQSKGKITCDQCRLDLPGQPEELVNEVSKQVRIFVYRLLCRHLQKNINTYGVLTGVRPVKLVHKLMDQGYEKMAVLARLTQEYQLAPDKAQLLWEIAANNRGFLLPPNRAKKLVSIYIGIPFCPSRCYYCSFPGAVLANYTRDLPPFLSALEQELNAIGTFLGQNEYAVQSIYIGGGTPTVLSAADLQILFERLHRWFISSATAEITIEAGRPDTLSPAKMKTLKQLGVSRICINPQTMNDSTLKTIGRNHDQKGVVQGVQWAREAGIKQINMDLIVGLPGETIRENTRTAEEILKIKPENLTVHTLAVKRGSSLALAANKTSWDDQVKEVEKGVKLFSEIFRQNGYLPYYLYRQKYMRADMENIGYSVPGSFCLYNIQMMEERQTIIGLGGGAASKFVEPGDWILTSFYNPKNPQTYCESVRRLINGKVDKLRALN